MSNFGLFCSYAHGDNDDGWVDTFVDNLSRICRKLTGVSPAIFMDRESLVTSDVWERKIRKALDSSRLLIAILSPSYVRSEWCRKEWEAFAVRESQMRESELISDEQGLIFPVLLFPLDRGRFGATEESFAAQFKQRQWMDVSSQVPGTPIRPEQIRALGEQVIDAIAGLERAHRLAVATHSKSAATIVDPVSGLEWSVELSPKEMTYEDAVAYVAEMASEGWRLPSKSELESIVDYDAVVNDSDASPYPLRQPFNAQRFGYLQSGTEVGGGHEGHWVMNVRNGHIFNGFGRKCYVRLVRSLPNKALQPTSRVAQMSKSVRGPSAARG